MKPKPYRIVGSWSISMCVVKVKYNTKYVIVKCKDSMKTLKMIENGLNAFIRGGKNNPAGFHFHMYNYVKDHPAGRFKVEYLLTTDNVYELLKREQEELDAGRDNPNMLNNQTEAYIQPYDPETDSYGWIPKNAYLNFNKWVKTRDEPKQTAG